MKTVKTTCPNCLKELTTKLFAVESSSTHTVLCRFCQFRFSIDGKGAVVEKGDMATQDLGRKKVIGIQHGKKRLTVDIPEGTKEYELLEKMEERIQEKVSRRREEDRRRQMERGGPTEKKDAGRETRREGVDDGGAAKRKFGIGDDMPPHDEWDERDLKSPPQGPYDPRPREAPWTHPGYDYRGRGPRPSFPDGFSLKKKMPLKEKIFYALSLIFAFFFFIFAVGYYMFSSEGMVSEEEMDISGVVTNETGGAVAGALVSVEGANRSTTTDENGSFALKDVETGKRTILVRAPGYRNFSFTTYLLGQNLNFDYDGTGDFEFQLSRDRKITEDKTDDIKRQANFLSVVSILYLVLVLLGLVFVYRKKDFMKTVGIFVFGILLSFSLMAVLLEVTLSFLAFLYFPLAVLLVVMLKGEFESHKRFPGDGFYPGSEHYPWGPPYQHPERGREEQERERVEERGQDKSPRRIKYSEQFRKRRQVSEETRKSHRKVSGNGGFEKKGGKKDVPETEVRKKDVPGKEGFEKSTPGKKEIEEENPDNSGGSFDEKKGT